jgi:hypothetical protein
MPCYSETRVTVDLGKVDMERLTRAAALANVTIRKRSDGRVVVSSYDTSRSAVDLENSLKQQYSVLTVQAAAQRFGWKVKATTTKQATTTTKQTAAKVVTMKLGR